jgi:ribose 1,5-bisphosphokinase
MPAARQVFEGIVGYPSFRVRLDERLQVLKEISGGTLSECVVYFFIGNLMQQGRLFYLMGASGVGKDSLLGYLRTHLSQDSPVLIPQRYITRPTTAGGEEHIELSRHEFHTRMREDGFAMHWQSHGYLYGIDAGIDRSLARGYQVVINGSRHYLETARSRYTNLFPVLITVSHDQLLERLLNRGRENEQEIEQRLLRAEALDKQLQDQDLIRLPNGGPLEQAGRRLLEMILEPWNLTPPGAGPTAATG